MSTTRKLDALFYDKGGAVYNVQHSDFGAVGDGTTDDSGAFQSANDEAASGRGGVVFIPPGSYSIDSAIEFSDNVHFMGAGYNATLIVAGSNMTSMFTPKDATTLTSQARFSGMRLSAGSATVTNVIRLLNTEFCAVDSCHVRNATNGVHLEIDGSTAGNFWNKVIQCEAENNTNGIQLTGSGGTGPNGSFVAFNQLRLGDIGILVNQNCSHNVFIGNHMEGGSVDHFQDNGGFNRWIGCYGETSSAITGGITVGANANQSAWVGCNVGNNASFTDNGARTVFYGILNNLNPGVLLPHNTEANRPSAGTAGSLMFNPDRGTLAFDDGTNWLASSLVTESANAEEPQGTYDPGTVVDFTDSGDGTGDGLYMLMLDGTTWKQIAT